MASFRFSSLATYDMAEITAYTLREWGVAQMTKYLSAIEQCATLLAGNPGLGRPCGQILPGLYRFEKEQHVLYYLPEPDRILVARILHKNMQPESHNFVDESPNSLEVD
jgi:plasmid stabilization system protein ParE